MRPAFSSTIQAAAFLVMLLGLVTAPWLAGRSLLPPREQAYATEGWNWGPYPWIQRQIFEETNAIDIAFVGSSHLMFGIDTPYVQQQLDYRQGHKSVVRSVCWDGKGFDALYFITRDLLAHRRVKMLVFYDETDASYPFANAEAPNWVRFDEDAGDLAGLPIRDEAEYYLGDTLEMPRSLLDGLTPNLPENTNDPTPNYIETAFNSPNPETRLGSVRARNDNGAVLGTKFVPITPHSEVTPADVRIYTPANGSNFKFLNERIPAWQIYFARKFGQLARDQGCQLVLLHLPTLDEKSDPIITETEYWPDLLKTKVTMMGIPSERLFHGLVTRTVNGLFNDAGHLNESGQKYFTSLITPDLLQIYENRTHD